MKSAKLYLNSVHFGCNFNNEIFRWMIRAKCRKGVDFNRMSEVAQFYTACAVRKNMKATRKRILKQINACSDDRCSFSSKCTGWQGGIILLLVSFIYHRYAYAYTHIHRLSYSNRSAPASVKRLIHTALIKCKL